MSLDLYTPVVASSVRGSIVYDYCGSSLCSLFQDTACAEEFVTCFTSVFLVCKDIGAKMDVKKLSKRIKLGVSKHVSPLGQKRQNFFLIFF